MKSCILPPHPWSSSENCQCSESKHSLKCPPLHANICSSDLVWTSVRLLCVPHCDAGPPHFMDVVTYSRSHGLALTQIFRVPGATLMGSRWLLGKGISPHIRPPRIPITHFPLLTLWNPHLHPFHPELWRWGSWRSVRWPSSWKWPPTLVGPPPCILAFAVSTSMPAPSVCSAKSENNDRKSHKLNLSIFIKSYSQLREPKLHLHNNTIWHSPT